MKYFRQFKEKKKITEISKKEMIKRVSHFYKNPKAMIDSVSPVPKNQNSIECIEDGHTCEMVEYN